MRIILTIITALLLTSCSDNDLKDLKIELTFDNGNKDTVRIIADQTELSRGDFYYSKGAISTTIASGVRSYKIIEIKNPYDENGKLK